jgi:polyhydroxybutyrate depolymerase
MKRISLALLALTFSLLACARNAPRPSADVTGTLIHDGIERTYILHIPSSYDESKPVPLVVALHGGGGNAEHQRRVSGFNQLADEQGFIVVYPNGTGRFNNILLTWNGGTCCEYAVENQTDDTGFIRALIAELESKFNIDPKRIYATGMSNGAIMSYRLACEAADLFAAIAPVSGTQNLDTCQPSEPVSVIHFHGTADEQLPYDGGVGAKSTTGVNYVSVSDTLAFWILRDNCPSRAGIEQNGDVTHLTYSPCDASTSVELYKIEGGGHAWPGADGPGWVGGDEPTQSISATRLIWEFFTAHPKP